MEHGRVSLLYTFVGICTKTQMNGFNNDNNNNNNEQ